MAVFALLLVLAVSAKGLRVTKVDVPRYLLKGQDATLKCHFVLEGEKLYSLNWWKDEKQFYQFFPQKHSMVVFEIQGVRINANQSNLHSVRLTGIDKTSEGEYRCEIVAEAPFFNTHIHGSNLSIIDPPDGPPVIRGQKSLYHPGEIIRLNCTSYRSRPISHLKWEIYPYIKDFFRTSGLNSKSHRKNVDNSVLPPMWSPTNTLSPLSQPQFKSPVTKDLTMPVLKSSVGSWQKNSWIEDFFHFNKTKRKRLTKKKLRRIKHVSNYTEIPSYFVQKHPVLRSEDSTGKLVQSATLSLKFPIRQKDAYHGQLTLRCSAKIHHYVWATEVRVNIADVPVADPQQLPTLHGKGSHRNMSCMVIPESVVIILTLMLSIVTR